MKRDGDNEEILSAIIEDMKATVMEWDWKIIGIRSSPSHSNFTELITFQPLPNLKIQRDSRIICIYHSSVHWWSHIIDYYNRRRDWWRLIDKYKHWLCLSKIEDRLIAKCLWGLRFCNIWFLAIELMKSLAILRNCQKEEVIVQLFSNTNYHSTIQTN